MLVISNRRRARPISKLLARLLPELYSTRSNYYYLLRALILATTIICSLSTLNETPNAISELMAELRARQAT